ncbi:MAG: alcohol phosphatidyltransferase [Propionibacteriales bacterium]|nr:alcohol phosphatidyltransferase [Propionibacteriales bacterium]
MPDATLAEWSARPGHESFTTLANLVTVLRTIGAVGLAMVAAQQGSLALLLASLAVYWIGDVADGWVARLTHHETRIGAVFDILCDRLCAGAFYMGLAWLQPDLAIPIGIYLLQFMAVDAFLSMAFLAWPILSPNYFYVVDRTLWRWNWSKPGKAINSAAFAVLLVLTQNPWLGSGVALCLLGLKVASTVRLSRLGLPIPPGTQDSTR